jgi:hypothetical protein
VEILALLGYGSFVLVSLAVGGGLLLRWWRARGTAELAIGMTLAAGGLSYGIAIAAFSVPGLPRIVAAPLEMLSAFCAHLATAALALALRSIFRPGARWARALQLALTVALAGAFATRLVDPLAFPPPGYVFWPYVGIGAFIYAWAALECLLAHRTMRQRARLGLADPSLARRFLLWGVAGTAALGIYVAAMVERLEEPVEMATWMIALTSALGLVAASAILLAFHPRRLARRAPVEARRG